MLGIDARELKTINPVRVRPWSTVLNHYSFHTADDHSNRDPISWYIYHLGDDLSWQLLGRALHSFPFSA